MILFIRLLSSSKRRSVATADDVQVVMCAADREAIVGAAWSLPFILCSGCYHATAAAGSADRGGFLYCTPCAVQLVAGCYRRGTE